MISREELDNLREYLKSNGAADSHHNPDWYILNGLEISIDADYDCGDGVVFVYLIHDKWLIACTNPMPMSKDNPHKIMVLDFDGLIRLINGGEMAYNNMETERVLDEL